MTDCIVIGAGPAGLAMSVALTGHRVEHLVVERGRVGETWRTQRWDSFRLNTPGWANAMLGSLPRDAYLTGAEVVQRLVKLADAAPVRESVVVTRLVPNSISGHLLQTNMGPIRARTVVVATGNQNVPQLPPAAGRFPKTIMQVHAANYHNAAELPGGAVLVVGSAQSGCQIAEDLLAAHRDVVLATSPVGRVPTPYRGRNTVDWLSEAGFFNQRLEDLPDPAITPAHQPIIAPGGRPLSVQTLARAGAIVTGRLLGVDQGRVQFDSSALANVAAGERFAATVRGMVDTIIERSGRYAPPAESDPAGGPLHLKPPTSLEVAMIGSVVWCTGFGSDFSWLDSALLDTDGQPHHHSCAATVPGVWYLGLRWLTHRASATLHGFPTDAATVAHAIVAYLEGNST